MAAYNIMALSFEWGIPPSELAERLTMSDFKWITAYCIVRKEKMDEASGK